MGEFRQDPLFGNWVIVNPGRGLRPNQFSKEKKQQDEQSKGEKTNAAMTDPFSPECEHLTPPEVGRIEENNEWQMRWFENKFAILVPKAHTADLTTDEGFRHKQNYGYHEIIVENRDITKQMWDMSLKEITWLIAVYSNRIEKIHRMDKVKYVQVFKNHGESAGASLEHSHSQVLALPLIPDEIRKYLEIFSDEKESPFLNLFRKERKGPRWCFENEGFVAFTPYASRFSYELWIMPKAPRGKLSEITSPVLCAEVLQKALEKLKVLNVDFNMVIDYAPEGYNGHLRLRIMPRINKWAGFELATGVQVITTTPEDAAKFYRGEE